MPPLAKGDALAHGQGVFKVLPNVLDARGFAQPDAVLEVEEQAAVIQIYSANRGEAVVHDKVFGMDKTRSVLINVDTGFQKRG